MGTGTGFLYEIVCNKESGFDTDKWDYIVRDTYSIGLSSVVTDMQRFILNSKVLNGHLCYNFKLYDDIFEIFRMRYILHKKVYNHHATIGIELMICDLMRKLQVQDKDDDSIIFHQEDPLRTRLETRRHYKCIFQEITDQCPVSKQLESALLGTIRVVRTLGFGMDSHPMGKIRFYKKTEPTESFQCDCSQPTCNRSNCIKEYKVMIFQTS